MNAGTTILSVVRHLRQHRDLIIATNNLRIPMEIAPSVFHELYVFGGAVRHIFLATEPLVREVLHSALVAPSEHVQLAVAGLGDDSVAVGAAELAFAPLLDDPLGVLRPAVRGPAWAGA